MLLGMLGLFRAAYPFIVQTKLWDMRLGPMQGRKECDSERVGPTKGRVRGGYGEREFFDDCLSFVSTGVYGGERGHRGKGGRNASLSLYILLSLPLAGLVSRALRGRQSEQLNEKNISVIEGFCGLRA